MNLKALANASSMPTMPVLDQLKQVNKTCAAPSADIVEELEELLHSPIDRTDPQARRDDEPVKELERLTRKIGILSMLTAHRRANLCRRMNLVKHRVERQPIFHQGDTIKEYSIPILGSVYCVGALHTSSNHATQWASTVLPGQDLIHESGLGGSHGCPTTAYPIFSQFGGEHRDSVNPTVLRQALKHKKNTKKANMVICLTVEIQDLYEAKPDLFDFRSNFADLRRVEFFNEWSDGDLELVSMFFQPRFGKFNETILEQGSSNSTFYVIVQGQVEIVSVSLPLHLKRFCWLAILTTDIDLKSTINLKWRETRPMPGGWQVSNLFILPQVDVEGGRETSSGPAYFAEETIVRDKGGSEMVPYSVSCISSAGCKMLWISCSKMAQLVSHEGRNKLTRKLLERKFNMQSRSLDGSTGHGFAQISLMEAGEGNSKGNASPFASRRRKPAGRPPNYAAFKRFSPLETPHEIPQNRVLPYYKEEGEVSARRAKPRESSPRRPHTSMDRSILPTVSTKMNPSLEFSPDEEPWKVLLQIPWEGTLSFTSAPQALVEARRAERNRIRRDMPTLVDSRSLLNDRRLEQLQAHMPAGLQSSHLSLYFPFNRKYVDSVNASLVRMKEIEYKSFRSSVGR